MGLEGGTGGLPTSSCFLGQVFVLGDSMPNSVPETGNRAGKKAGRKAFPQGADVLREKG